MVTFIPFGRTKSSVGGRRKGLGAVPGGGVSFGAANKNAAAAKSSTVFENAFIVVPPGVPLRRRRTASRPAQFRAPFGWSSANTRARSFEVIPASPSGIPLPEYSRARDYRRRAQNRPADLPCQNRPTA